MGGTIPARMVRRPDWRVRLDAHLAAAARHPFAWGSHDCVSFAAGAVEAMTGEDLRAGTRYATAIGARRLLRRLGAADVLGLARAHLPEIPVAAARIGDLAAVATPDGPALAVVGGGHVLAPAHQGLAALPLSAAHAAFRV